MKVSPRRNTSQSGFQRDLLPPARSFYERELGKLSRPSRGWVRGRCPFHDSRSGLSFSVNLDGGGGFYCFGCGVKGGDVVAFVQLRDRCGFVDACKILGAWKSVTPTERVEIARRQQERAWHRQREIEQKQTKRRERLKLRDELHTTVRIYYDLGALLREVGPVGTVAESCWSALPPTLDCWRLEESAYCKAAGLENPYE